VNVLLSAESSWKTWLLIVWKFWVLSESDVVPSVWRVSKPSVNWPSVLHSYGSSMPRMLELPPSSGGSNWLFGSRKMVKPDRPKPTSRRVTPNEWSWYQNAAAWLVLGWM